MKAVAQIYELACSKIQERISYFDTELTKISEEHGLDAIPLQDRCGHYWSGVGEPHLPYHLFKDSGWSIQVADKECCEVYPAAHGIQTRVRVWEWDEIDDLLSLIRDKKFVECLGTP